MGEKNKNQSQEDSDVATLIRPKVKEPPLYNVILLNDDYTTMDFVVHVLQKFFHKDFGEANRIMLNVHQKGRGVCGIYPYDIASTKVVQVTDYSRKHEMPLQCVMEK